MMEKFKKAIDLMVERHLAQRNAGFLKDDEEVINRLRGVFFVAKEVFEEADFDEVTAYILKKLNEEVINDA